MQEEEPELGDQGEQYPGKEKDETLEKYEVKTNEIRMEPAILDWLEKEITRKKQVIFEDTPLDWDEMLTKIGKGKKKKMEKLVSRIERDEAHNRVIHIATLATDKSKEEVTGKDYNVQTINLGPASMEHDIEEYEGSNAIIINRLRKETQSKHELRKENERIKKCLEDVMKPLQSLHPSSSATPISCPRKLFPRLKR